MFITCPICTEGTVDGSPCYHCDGDGEISLTDNKFKELAESNFRSLTGVVWDAILTNQADIEAKVDLQDVEIAAIKAKTDNLPNDTANWLTILRNKIDAIKAVVDEI